MEFVKTENPPQQDGYLVSPDGADVEELDAYSRTVSSVASAVRAGVVRIDVFGPSRDGTSRRGGTGSGFRIARYIHPEWLGPRRR